MKKFLCRCTLSFWFFFTSSTEIFPHLYDYSALSLYDTHFKQTLTEDTSHMKKFLCKCTPSLSFSFSYISHFYMSSFHCLISLTIIRIPYLLLERTFKWSFFMDAYFIPVALNLLENWFLHQEHPGIWYKLLCFSSN